MMVVVIIEETAEAIDWGALATLLAVLVALFLEPLVALWRRPRVGVRIQMSPPDCVKIPFTIVDKDENPIRNVDGYFLRFWVNNSGRGEARRVEVYAHRLCREQKGGTFEEVHTFLPMNLKWSNMTDPPAPIVSDVIGRDMGRHCDLGKLLNDQPRQKMPNVISQDETDEMCLVLALQAEPNSGNNRLPGGKYRLELRIAGANFSPIKRVIEIDFEANWYEDRLQMFSKGIRASVI